MEQLSQHFIYNIFNFLFRIVDKVGKINLWILD